MPDVVEMEPDARAGIGSVGGRQAGSRKGGAGGDPAQPQPGRQLEELAGMPQRRLAALQDADHLGQLGFVEHAGPSFGGLIVGPMRPVPP